MSLTTDPNDPRLGRGTDTEKVAQHDVYLVLSDEERAKGFVRPVRASYLHSKGDAPCNQVTTMGRAIAETYARDPYFYGSTYCCTCCKHLPVSAFVWVGDGQTVGS